MCWSLTSSRGLLGSAVCVFITLACKFKIWVCEFENLRPMNSHFQILTVCESCGFVRLASKPVNGFVGLVSKPPCGLVGLP